MVFNPLKTVYGRDDSDESGRSDRDIPFLCIVLIPLIIIVPVLPMEAGFRLITIFFLSLLFVIGVYCMRGERRRFLTACILALIGVEIFWVSIWSAAAGLFIFGEIFLLLFLLHQVSHFTRELIETRGSVIPVMSHVLCLILLCGLLLGTGLHLSRWLSRTLVSDPQLLHAGFAQAIPEGLMVLTGGGTLSSSPPPLTSLVIVIGSIMGFLLLVLSTGKIAGVFLKKD